MSWTKLLQDGKVHRHVTSKNELTEIRRLVARDIADASLHGLSEDRRFATAYNAALQTAKMAIACAGYRVASVPGHHRITFQGTKLALGKPAARLADYFDACRRKRNEIDYTGASIATGTEAEELLLHAKTFLSAVEAWIAAKHTALVP
ncbi:MAG: SAV_6107 family HEPN domain-containing protein [Terracidiphilus sp.]